MLTILPGIVLAFVWLRSPQPPTIAVFLALLPFVACALALLGSGAARRSLILRALASILIAMSSAAAFDLGFLYLPGLIAMVVATLAIRPNRVSGG